MTLRGNNYIVDESKGQSGEAETLLRPVLRDFGLRLKTGYVRQSRRAGGGTGERVKGRVDR